MAVTATDSGLPRDIAVQIGPQLVGNFLNWMLYGVLIIQVYIYTITFPEDGRTIKCLVYGMFLAESVQTFMASSDAFVWFVYGWGDQSSIQRLNLNWFDIPILTSFVSMTVQCFFAWRVWVLSRSIYLPVIIVLCSFAQGAAGIATGIQLKVIGTFKGVHEIYHVVIIWYSGSALTDIIIAITMTYFLLRAKENVVSQTQYIIKRLVKLVIETGTLTASAALVAVITFQALQNESLYLAPATVFAKLYSNTLLAVFNNRAFFRAGQGTFAISTTTQPELATTVGAASPSVGAVPLDVFAPSSRASPPEPTEFDNVWSVALGDDPGVIALEDRKVVLGDGNLQGNVDR